MNYRDNLIPEGYWRSRTEPDYPDPQPQAEPVSKDFIQRLCAVQSRARREWYKGSSVCRICGILNGSTEFEFNGYRWPDGFMHYLIEHNVHPTPEFVKMIEDVIELEAYLHQQKESLLQMIPGSSVKCEHPNLPSTHLMLWADGNSAQFARTCLEDSIAIFLQHLASRPDPFGRPTRV